MIDQANRLAMLAEAQNLLGVGRLVDAERVCRNLLAAKADDPGALMFLSVIALQNGSFDRAESLAAQCAAIEPANAVHPTNIGKARGLLGRLEGAIEAFDRALAMTPNFGPALAGKANALNQLGNAERAQATLAPLVQARQETAEVALIYATLVQEAGDHTLAIEVASRHLNNQSIQRAVRTRLGLLVGKAYEALADADKAFHAYLQANHVRAQSATFDPAKYKQTVDRIIHFFTADCVRRLQRVRNRSELPVFIAGMARSGTSLVEQIIATHPQGFGAGEITALERIVNSSSAQVAPANAYPDWLGNASLATIEAMSQEYLDESSSLGKGATRVVNKYLRNHYHIGLIWMLFPKGRIIHCRRDPMDSCFSCYTSALSPIMHGYCSDLRHLGFYYNQYERLMDHWVRTLDYPILDVQYEELVANQEQVTRRIIEFCGLPWDDRCLQFHQTKRAVRTLSYDQVRRPIYDKSIGRYKPFEAYLWPLKEVLNEPRPSMNLGAARPA